MTELQKLCEEILAWQYLDKFISPRDAAILKNLAKSAQAMEAALRDIAYTADIYDAASRVRRANLEVERILKEGE